jgi:hypothetical protein
MLPKTMGVVIRSISVSEMMHSTTMLSAWTGNSPGFSPLRMRST